ncbi:hypothetical protein HNY73_006786 [Argiope bruennichi]|uniref:Uncharacterized protein n=1 Tax=Argiope bruennichi TaxID=94029 RepID=A0A8T0FHG8_ARGBR|nr:hypothetical protein HNY73_006786 [Argiope bruennichi]
MAAAIGGVLSLHVIMNRKQSRGERFHKRRIVKNMRSADRASPLGVGGASPNRPGIPTNQGAQVCDLASSGLGDMRGAN